ncbi:hypothetical protein [Halorientalis halophila]|uniref:hypothetical protein n=1 Tax=Halorientalis halophila TaxID=3108499 RepID=UPI00300B048B
MNNSIGTRAAALVALAAIGLGTAWAGTALGLGAPLATGDAGAEFSVSGAAVTLSTGDRSTTLVENTAALERIEIAERDGRLSVETEARAGDPLTDRQRDRALEIARANETIQAHLAELDGAEFAVEPIVGIPAEGMGHVSLNASDDAMEATDRSDGTTRIDFDEDVTIERHGDAVTIRPGDQQVVEDTVYVEIRTGDGEVAYRAQVNLPEERVLLVADERAED